MSQGEQPEDREPDESIGCSNHGSEMPNPPVSATDPESCDVDSLDDVLDSKVRESEEDLKRIFGNNPGKPKMTGKPKMQTSSSEDTPRLIAFSEGQGIESHQPIDAQSMSRVKLLKGGLVTCIFFLPYFVLNWLVSARETFVEQGVHYTALITGILALCYSVFLYLNKRISLEFMNFLVYSLLVSTMSFLIFYHVKMLYLYKSNTPAAIVLPFFAVVTAYGIFVTEPNLTIKKVENPRSQLQQFFVPSRSRFLAWLLHFVAMCPIPVTAVVAISQGTLRHFVIPLVEMAIWLFLGRCIAHFGPYQFDQLTSDRARRARYVLHRLIDNGGICEVYLAKDNYRNIWCIYKNMKPKYAISSTLSERFRREASVTARLNHVNIVKIYDVNWPLDGVPYYTMEYVPGSNLRDFVHKHGPLPPGRAIFLLRQICQALRITHAENLIHRDIKPANIMISSPSEKGEVAKILDFGLVRDEKDSSVSGLTEIGDVLGTPEFMSPEQARGEKIDKQSDICALGGVAYFLLTGFPPFANKRAHLDKPIVPPSVHQRGIPNDLEAVILKCLKENPSERYEDATSMEKALAACECANDWDEGTMARWWKSNPTRDLRPKADATHPGCG